MELEEATIEAGLNARVGDNMVAELQAMVELLPEVGVNIGSELEDATGVDAVDWMVEEKRADR